MRTCSVEGCGRQVRASGLCRRCYRRRWSKTPQGKAAKKRYARALYLRRMAGIGTPCAKADCKHASQARGLCMTHYVMQWMKTPKGRARLARKRRFVIESPVRRDRRYAKGRRNTEALTDSYIRKTLLASPAAQLSPILIETKRVQIQILRRTRKKAT